MKIEVHHHHHMDAPTVDRLERLADRLEGIVKSFTSLEKIAMRNIDDLVSAVADETSVEESLETLADQLTTEIAALKSQTTDPATAAKIDALVTQIQNNKSNIVAAVQRNTPATDQGPTAAPVGSQLDPNAPAPVQPAPVTAAPASDQGSAAPAGDGTQAAPVQPAS